MYVCPHSFPTFTNFKLSINAFVIMNVDAFLLQSHRHIFIENIFSLCQHKE